MKRIGLNSARIFVNGSNLLTFCNKALKDADPEREERDWGANLAYPLMRTYNFGLNIKLLILKYHEKKYFIDILIMCIDGIVRL